VTGCSELRAAGPRSGGGLVEAELDPAGEGDGRQQASALVADRPGGLDPLGLEGGHVVGHEVQLGPATLGGRVDGDLGRRQGEDQPAAGVDRPGPQDLGQGGAGPVGVFALEDGVGAVDHGGIPSVDRT
jgi:hypothetical protein